MSDDSKPPAISETPSGDSGAHISKAPLTPEQREKRWTDAIEVGRQAGLKCTGVPGESYCDEPACIIVVLGIRMFGLPCRAHTDALVNAILKRGHAAVRTEPLIDHATNPQFLTSARFIRDQNVENGVRIPDANPHSTSKKPKKSRRNR